MPAERGPVSYRTAIVLHGAIVSPIFREPLALERLHVLPLAARSPPMPFYRLYYLTATDGIERFDDFLAPHDQAARVFSLDRLAGQAIELWQQSRRISRFNPDSAEVHVLREGEASAGQ